MSETKNNPEQKFTNNAEGSNETKDVEEYSIDNIKYVIREQIESRGKVKKLELTPEAGGFKLECELNAGMAYGNVFLDANLVIKNGKIETQNVNIKARPYVKPTIESYIPQVGGKIKEYLEKKSGKKIDNLNIQGDRLLIEYKVPAAKQKAPEHKAVTPKVPVEQPVIQIEKKTAEIQKPLQEAPEQSKAKKDSAETTPSVKEATKEKIEAVPKGTAGEQLVQEAKNNPEIPQPVREALTEPKNQEAAADFIDNQTSFGSKMKKMWSVARPALAGFAAGAAVRAAGKFLLMRTLDIGSVGASAAVGAGVGGAMEFYKSNKGENKRLLNLDTYNKALDGYEQMSDLEKIKTYTAVESALKKKNLDSSTHVELAARMVTLKTLVDNRDSWKRQKGAKKVELLLKLRTGADQEQLSSQQKGEAKELLKQLQKEKGLSKNRKKIALSTIKGVVIGGAGGALGAWAFENVSGFVESHGWFGHHGAAPSGGEHSATHTPSHAAETSHTATTHITEKVTVHIPASEDTQTLEKTVWDACKHYLEGHGVAHPSTQDINEAMIRICHENGIEISGHHNVADFKGFHHEHFEKLIDTKLQKGMPLHGFDKLTDIIERAGGHATEAANKIVTHEFVTHNPGSNAVNNAREAVSALMDKDQAKIVLENNRVLENISLGIMGTGGVFIATAGYKAYKNSRNKQAESGIIKLDIREKVRRRKPTPEIPPFAVIGNEQEAKIESLEERFKKLEAVKQGVVKRIQYAVTFLNPESPDLEKFREIMAPFDDQTIWEQQFNVLTAGLSENDMEKLGPAWNAAMDELEALAKPFEDAAEKLEAQANAAAEQEASVTDDSYDDGAEQQTTTEARAPRTSAKSLEEWKTAMDAKSREVFSWVEKINAVLRKGDIAAATAARDSAQAEINSLHKQLSKLKGTAKVEALKQMVALQKSIDKYNDKIPETKTAEAKDLAKAKIAAEETEAELHHWQIPYYRLAVELQIAPRLKSYKNYSKKEKIRLETFIGFADERNANAFSSVYGQGYEEVRQKFIQALRSNKQGNSKPIRALCDKILQDGRTNNKNSEADQLLDVMSTFLLSVSLEVEAARRDFK